VTLRTNRDRTRLYIANGTDESATILSLPNLAVVREITMEGEAIRDAVPDPSGKYLYLLGRRVHVFDADGQSEIRTLPIADPMAIAVTSNGATLAVLGTEDYGNAKATAVALYDAANNFNEITRDPLQTDQTIGSAVFAAGDRSLVAFSGQSLFEKPIVTRAAKTMTSGRDGRMRVTIDGVARTVDTGRFAGARATKNHYRALLFSAHLTAGKHTVTITNLATAGRPTIAIDGIGLAR
jgi:hypothetical protein